MKYILIPASVVAHAAKRNLDPTARHVLWALCAYASSKPDRLGEDAHPYCATLAKLTGYSVKTVARALRRLVKCKMIAVTDARLGHATCYKVLHYLLQPAAEPKKNELDRPMDEIREQPLPKIQPTNGLKVKRTVTAADTEAHMLDRYSPAAKDLLLNITKGHRAEQRRGAFAELASLPEPVVAQAINRLVAKTETDGVGAPVAYLLATARNIAAQQPSNLAVAEQTADAEEDVTTPSPSGDGFLENRCLCKC